MCLALVEVAILTTPLLVASTCYGIRYPVTARCHARLSFGRVRFCAATFLLSFGVRSDHVSARLPMQKQGMSRLYFLASKHSLFKAMKIQVSLDLQRGGFSSSGSFAGPLSMT